MKLMPVIAIVAAVAGIAGAAAFWAPGAIDAPGTPKIGIANFSPSDAPKPAPAIAFRNAEGAEVTLADFRGKVLVVNFWATWCGPCVEEMPSLARLAETGKAEGIEVLALSVDRPQLEDGEIRRFLDGHEAGNLALFRDNGMALARGFSVPGLPTTVVIDAEGNLRGRLVGPADWASDAALALVRGFRAQ